MTANREKTSSVMGFVISTLMHGIFLAGCVAIDFSVDNNYGNAPDATKSEISKVSPEGDMAKVKS